MKRPKEGGSVGEVSPHLVQEWSSKNSMSPYEVSYGSNSFKVWWICLEGHEWEAVPLSRTTLNAGCPYCSGRLAIPGVTDLGSKYPELLSMWSLRNKKSPQEIARKSHQKIWLKCPLGHEYFKVPADLDRTGLQCKVCNNRTIVSGVNDLATTHPEIAAQWDYSKNSKPPSAFTYGSEQKVWWLCDANGHSWETAIKVRTRGYGCPKCSNKVSPMEEDVYTFMKELSPDVEQSNRKVISPYEIDIYSPSLKIGVEFNGMKYHSDYFLLHNRGMSAEELHSRKKSLAENAGVTLGFVWADDWRDRKDEVKTAILLLVENGELSPILNILSKG